ncbi:hypothetical protein [Flavobacterium sp.]|uniref:hypothetical protein n=1 Tax=Flavobacterium sp. TaxID=239 RepID=UPI0039E6BB5E
MKTSYPIALTLYGIVLTGLLLFVLMMSLGTKQDAQFTTAHYLICLFVVWNVAGLVALPYAGKLTRLLAICNTVLLLLGLVFALSIVFPMDLGWGTCAFWVVFVGSAVFLLKENVRSIRFKR